MPASNTKTTRQSSATVETKASTEIAVSFEQAYAELESIVAQMESGNMPLQASLAAYTRGNFLLQFCQKSLAAVEQQVQILNDNNQLSQFKSLDD
jgi:exodeoxyribonuclease VII small subunit